MKLLMHMCCAPCATFPVEEVQKEGITVDGLYYNPNIHPYEEFKKREDQVKKLAKEYNIKVHFMPDFEQEIWENLKDKSKNRCTMCYQKRIQRLVKFAKLQKYDAVTTSMLVSPYQDHEKIKNLLERYSERYGIKFYYKDFRKGYHEGQKKAKDMGLYCQRYCGCILSLQEAIKEISENEKKKRKQ